MIKRYVDHSGGQNNQVNQFLVQDNESTLIKNASTEILGAIKRGPGYAVRRTTVGAADILGLYEYRKSTTGTKYKLMATGSAIYTDSGVSWDTSLPGMTNGVKNEFEVFMDTAFKVNGTDPNATFNGTSWTDYSVSTNYFWGTILNSLIKKWHESLYIAGNAESKSRVWFSDKPQGEKLTWGWESSTNLATTAGSPVVTSSGAFFKVKNIKPGDNLRILAGNNKGDYVIRTIDSDTQLTLATNVTNTTTSQSYEAGSNWFEVGQDDGDDITGFGENSDRLLVFKNNSFHRFDGSSVMKLADIGTPTQRTIVNIQKWTLFANRLGIFSFDGVEPQQVAKKVQKYFTAIPLSNLSKMVAWSEGDVYKVYIGDVTVDDKYLPNCVVCYDLSENNFTTLALPDAVRAVTKFTDTEDQLVFGNSAGQVYNLNSGNKYGSKPIDFEWITKYIDLDDPENEKQVNGLVIFGNNLEGVKLSIIADNGRPQTIATLQATSEYVNCRVNGRRFQLIFSHADVNKPIIEGFSFVFEKITDV